MKLIQEDDLIGEVDSFQATLSDQFLRACCLSLRIPIVMYQWNSVKWERPVFENEFIANGGLINGLDQFKFMLPEKLGQLCFLWDFLGVSDPERKILIKKRKSKLFWNVDFGNCSFLNEKASHNSNGLALVKKMDAKVYKEALVLFQELITGTHIIESCAKAIMDFSHRTGESFKSNDILNPIFDPTRIELFLSQLNRVLS